MKNLIYQQFDMCIFVVYELYTYKVNIFGNCSSRLLSQNVKVKLKVNSFSIESVSENEIFLFVLF